MFQAVVLIIKIGLRRIGYCGLFMAVLYYHFHFEKIMTSDLKIMTFEKSQLRISSSARITIVIERIVSSYEEGQSQAMIL